MKTSIFLTSFFSTNCRGSKFFTSPAILALKPDASKWVIGPMPLRPAQRASQVAAVPRPSDDTRPTPVTTTRLPKLPPVLGIEGVISSPSHASRCTRWPLSRV